MVKFLIASDVHGSEKYCKLLLEAFEREGADRLFLLGDILYHGPRNPLPEEYNPQNVANLLSAYADKILCVRGNCDSEVDQMLLPFPILSDCAEAFADGLLFVLSHGHKDPPPLLKNDIYLTGHTHIPLKEKKDFIHLNPGSVSLPKEGTQRGYILYSDKKFEFKTLGGETYDTLDLNAPATVETAPAAEAPKKIVKRKLIIRRR